MRRIAVLPSAVADQIAAGEVVERPASVVKELIENALDAEAKSIDVVVEEGGRSSISVRDDGVGMDRDDAVLAIERHATSKIRAASDLVGVKSYGFRGEALPAICSVSELVIETATSDGAGTRVRATAGSLVAVEDIARRRGTSVTASRLFFNAPARQKFLRSARSEWRAVTEMLTTIALTRGDVRFSLSNDGRMALELPPTTSLRERVATVWGVRIADRYLDVSDVHGPIGIEGLVERPADVGTAARRVHLVVNGRAVRDAGIIRAAEAAYRSTISSGLRPSMLLELTLPGAEVDVNVHPAKAEVRFRDRWPVERAVEAAVRRALGQPSSAAYFGGRPWSGVAAAIDSAPPTVDVEVLRREERPLDFDHDPGAPALTEIEAEGSPAGTATATEATSAPTIVVPPLLQLRRTYMMFEHEDGVVLIDQHSAHERVLFEEFMRTLTTGAEPSQRLLFPLTLHLGPSQAEAFEENRSLLESLGFEMDAFGGHTVLVHSVPMPHPRFDAERCLRETLDTLAGDRAAGGARHERLAATVACKAAIKAGDALSAGEMRALFIALASTTLPAHDVHGRSTIVHLGWDEVERRFGRR